MQDDGLAGDDIPVRLEIDVGGRMPSGALTVVERIAKFGEVETVILSRHGRLRGGYILDGVPRGRYPIESAKAVLEDPFGLEQVEIPLPTGDSVLVYPRLANDHGSHTVLWSRTGDSWRTVKTDDLPSIQQAGGDLDELGFVVVAAQPASPTATAGSGGASSGITIAIVAGLIVLAVLAGLLLRRNVSRRDGR